MSSEPFITPSPIPALLPQREALCKAYRMDETSCLNLLIPLAEFNDTDRNRITKIAQEFVINTRKHQKQFGHIHALIHQYDLSTDEGISLMCLAEALLRIPDKATADKLISDKISTVEWKEHLSKDHSFFINATTWSLLLTGKIYAPALDTNKSLWSALKRVYSRLGASMIRPIIMKLMKTLGDQFVLGQNIADALKKSQEATVKGYRFSYDMLGEAARTVQDAKHYFDLYQEAIRGIGQIASSDDPFKNPGISIKLSALHPRYEYTKHALVQKEILPLLITLAQEAKKYHLGLTIDAEEADRLDLSLDLFAALYSHPAFADFEGLGLAVQAYQKRASFVIDYLITLARQYKKRIMVRLVKGAYWDTEIKLSQVHGLNDYPVFTRKSGTDVSYLACAKKLLSHTEHFYCQFGTHNAYSIAAILEMVKAHPHSERYFEFQCLHGMGRPLYDEVMASTQHRFPCRIYAPVGIHKDLLGYLVRRLLENGANSSFMNRMAHEAYPVEKIVFDPVMHLQSLPSFSHPRIPKPQHIYGARLNSMGMDLSNLNELKNLKIQMTTAAELRWRAAPIINGQIKQRQNAKTTYSPSHFTKALGEVTQAIEQDVNEALDVAAQSHTWAATSVEVRATILEKAADLLQNNMPRLMVLLSEEGGRCILDCISEVREAIDFCRYYASEARRIFAPQELPGPTGEKNILTLHPRGIIVCISPWNFPAAIFTGQIAAALAAGNSVIAKPAEQTPLIAFQIIQLLHQAGVPADALQLMIGKGSVIGKKLVSDPRVAGVIFTGSTETAKQIEQTLSLRSGPIATFIAETGGQNAMIVDSSVLIEQTVVDIVQSAFNSAGQRCSALRVLFVQKEIATSLLEMLQGYMNELAVGDPTQLTTDIGPVIDESAQEMLKSHFAKLSKHAKLIAEVPLQRAQNGFYFAPCAFELQDLSLLTGEVFGPILHVIPYEASQLDQVIETIIQTGFGLTLGIASRIEATAEYIINRLPVGNMYVNRNMIGAVVGVQPFGGERLSGTGPKAGGPHYLPRLCVERTVSINTAAVGGNANLISLDEDDG